MQKEEKANYLPILIIESAYKIKIFIIIKFLLYFKD